MKRSILVVDDEPNIVLSIEFLLKQAGYDVRVARDGDAALKAVDERMPDLILLDVMMPGRNGYDVCQTIRGRTGGKAIKIIMLTARSRDIEGSGLGLSLAREMARAHGGDLTLLCSDSKLTAFALRLPLCDHIHAQRGCL